MNLVWTLLLLAAASVTVNSQACVSYQSIEQRVYEIFSSECESQFLALQLPQLVDSGLMSTILNPITKITGLSIIGTDVLSVKIRQETDGVYLDIVVILHSSCTEITSFDIKVEISLPTEITVLNDCPHYHFCQDSATIEISIADLNLIVLSEDLVTAVTLSVTQTVFSVMGIVEETLNAVSSALTAPFNIGQSSCHYIFQSVTLDPGQCTYGIKLVDNESNEYDSDGYDEYAILKDGEYNVFACAENILTEIIDYAIAGLEIKIPLVNNVQTRRLESVFPADVTVFLHLSFKSPPQCAISSDGVHITLLADIEIYAYNDVVFHAQVDLYIAAKVCINNLSLGLTIDIDTSISVDTNFQVIYVDSGCGCKDIILEKLSAILNSCLGDLRAELNLNMAILTPIPAIFGYPGHGRNCVPHPGCIRCSEY
ncbi:uncharacterized protein [Dendrobates tinctorius]|uniref:uncharacterized protein n=1 Tax=Dendrobates tinctorius TaxID=92724 RepID=UPI003CCA2897